MRAAISIRGMTYLSSHNRPAIISAKTVGCYFCLRIYPRKEITEWTDQGNTAICPHCGIDAVLASGVYGFTVSPAMLKALAQFWFTGKEDKGRNQ